MSPFGDRFTRGLLLCFVGLGLSSCQPYANTNGDIEVSFDASEFILLDAPATSCKVESAGGATFVSDIAPLHMNLGRLTLNWTPPDPETILKVIYVKLNIVSGGLANADRPITIASQDLTCVMKGNVGDSTGTKLEPISQISFPFQKDILIVGLRSSDATNRSSFAGTVSVIVYALLTKQGQQDIPVIGRTNARFQFQGVF